MLSGRWPVPVIDASVMVNALVVVGPPGDLARAELRGLVELPVPAIFGAEATSALRAMVSGGAISQARARVALGQLGSLRTVQYPFEPFARRVWELRDNLTVYDAWYAALAEQLGTELVTADKRLAGAAGPRCPVRLL